MTPVDEAGDIDWSQAPYIVGSGFAMGTADVVPGVSGGTMAVALGIYQQLLAAITSINAESVAALLRLRLARVLSLVHWRFLGMLVLGMAAGIGVMLKLVRLPVLIEEQPRLVYAFFFGLVVASALLLLRRVPHWNAVRVACLMGGTGFGLLVVTLVPVTTPESAIFLFFSGVVAICAMVLPGISGSFVLLILGKYAYVLNALGELDLAVLVPFSMGCLVGITSFSRVVGWALARFHGAVISALTGLLFGSLWRIWPYQHLTTIIVRDKPRVVGAEPFMPGSLEPVVVGLFLAGLGAVLLLEVVAHRRQRSQEQRSSN